MWHATRHVACDKCSVCCTWFAHDCTWATWAYVLETVHSAVRRLSKILELCLWMWLLLLLLSLLSFEWLLLLLLSLLSQVSCNYYYYYHHYYHYHKFHFKIHKAKTKTGFQSNFHSQTYTVTRKLSFPNSWSKKKIGFSTQLSYPNLKRKKRFAYKIDSKIHKTEKVGVHYIFIPKCKQILKAVSKKKKKKITIILKLPGTPECVPHP